MTRETICGAAMVGEFDLLKYTHGLAKSLQLFHLVSKLTSLLYLEMLQNDSMKCLLVFHSFFLFPKNSCSLPLESKYCLLSIDSWNLIKISHFIAKDNITFKGPRKIQNIHQRLSAIRKMMCVCAGRVIIVHKTITSPTWAAVTSDKSVFYPNIFNF